MYGIRSMMTSRKVYQKRADKLEELRFSFGKHLRDTDNLDHALEEHLSRNLTLHWEKAKTRKLRGCIMLSNQVGLLL